MNRFLFVKASGKQIPAFSVGFDTPEMRVGIWRDVDRADNAILVRLSVLPGGLKPLLVKLVDMLCHVRGRDDEILECSRRVRLGNSREYSEEPGAKVLFSLEANTACFSAGDKGLDLDMHEPGSFPITAQYIGVGSVAQCDHGGVAASAEFASDEELA